ncbi:MAG: flavin reductase family protein [Candidatus Kapaibacterium sp.]
MHRLDFNRRRDTPSASGDDLKQALRQFASGVTIVTAEHDGELFGITVSAFTSISLDPPIIMVSINTASAIAASITEAEHFGVHILAEDQDGLSARFAESLPGEEKYRDLTMEPGPSGAPAITGVLAALDCVLDQTLLVGTHMLMFGRVVRAVSRPEPGSPLLYYHRSYRKLAP